MSERLGKVVASDSGAEFEVRARLDEGLVNLTVFRIQFEGAWLTVEESARLRRKLEQAERAIEKFRRGQRAA